MKKESKKPKEDLLGESEEKIRSEIELNHTQI